MAETNFQICSRALTEIGANPITSFDDGTTEAIISGRHYEAAVRRALTESRWRFSTQQVFLSQLSTPPLDAPNSRWLYAYQMPSDLIQLNAVTREGIDVEYDTYGATILTNENDDLIADYTFRANETAFPSYFTDALVVDLMAIFLTGVARNPELAEKVRNRAENAAWPKARRKDSQQQTTRKLPGSRFIAFRRF